MKYEADEFYGDLHHLVQPIVGILKINPDLDPAYIIEGLSLALDLADMALGEGKTMRVVDLDRTRDLRADHGCGFFQNEDEDIKEVIQDRYRRRHHPNQE